MPHGLCPPTSSLFSLRKCRIFSVVLPTGVLVSLLEGVTFLFLLLLLSHHLVIILDSMAKCRQTREDIKGQCEGDGAGPHLAGKMTACHFAGVGRRSPGGDK